MTEPVLITINVTCTRHSRVTHLNVHYTPRGMVLDPHPQSVDSCVLIFPPQAMIQLRDCINEAD